MPAQDIPLENASNLRDLGGWQAADGRHVRRGLIFRAPALIGLSAADEKTIAALGLKTVCDFRGTRERASSPVFIRGVTNMSLPIEPTVGAGLKDIVRTAQARGHAAADDMSQLMRDAYQAYALQSVGQYRALFARILDEASLPLLLHCTAGKDRTGFGAALLLTALGVSWNDVMEDYLATNRFWRRESARGMNLPPSVATLLLEARSELLESAFTAIEREYGTMESYLVQAVGLAPQARTRLKDRLLQDQPP